MNFEDVYFSREHRFSLGQERESGRYYLSIPVTTGIFDYEEHYELDRQEFEKYLADPTTALEFRDKAKAQQIDFLLFVKPGPNRGMAS